MMFSAGPWWSSKSRVRGPRSRNALPVRVNISGVETYAIRGSCSETDSVYVVVRCARAELKVQLAQERQEREALERELEECKQQMAEAGLL